MYFPIIVTVYTTVSFLLCYTFGGWNSDSLQVSKFKSIMPRPECWEPITNYQTPNLQASRTEIRRPISKHQNSNAKGRDPKTNHQTPHSLRAKSRCRGTKLSLTSRSDTSFGGSGLELTNCIVLFCVIVLSRSECREPITNHQTWHIKHRRPSSYQEAEVRAPR